MTRGSIIRAERRERRRQNIRETVGAALIGLGAIGFLVLLCGLANLICGMPY